MARPGMGLERSRISTVAANHWRMVSDPCGAPLAESAYPGRSGITSRFTGVFTYAGGTETAFLANYNFAALAAAINPLLASTTSVTQSYNVVLPGQTFLNANAAAFRTIGACVSIQYVGTELNRAGTIYGGVLTANSIPAGIATTVDACKVLLPNETRTPGERILDLKWFPGYAEMEYDVSSGSDNFNNDHNALCVAAAGMTAGLGLVIRVTTIVEWLPKLTLGMSMPSPVAGTNPPAFYEALHEQASRSGIFTAAFQAAGMRANQYAAYAGQRMVDASVSAAVGYLSQGARRRIRN